MKFSLITPAHEVATLDAAYVNVPGEAGDFGVLPGHMPLIALLRNPGLVSVTDTAGTTHTFTVKGEGEAQNAGFADIRGNRVTILAESASSD